MVDPEDDDLIMSMILERHLKDYQLIEDILEEQQKKTVKFPLTTFFHRSSLKSIISTLNQFKFTRIQRPRPVKSEQLTSREKEEKLKQQQFENLMKSKSGLGGVLIAEDRRRKELKEHLKRGQTKPPSEEPAKPLTGIERDCLELKQSFEAILEGIDGEERLDVLERYFLDPKERGAEAFVEDNLLKSFRKLRKIREAMKKEMKKELKREDRREDKLRSEFQERLRKVEMKYLQERDFFSFLIKPSTQLKSKVPSKF